MSVFGSRFERFEQPGVHFQIAATISDLDIRLRDPMEITSTGDQQIETLGQFKVTRRLRLAVGAVMDLDAVKARFLEHSDATDKTVAAVFHPGRMSKHCEAFCFSDPADRLSGGGKLPSHVGRPAFRQIPVERFLG